MSAKKRIFAITDTHASRAYTSLCLKCFKDTVTLNPQTDALFVIDNDNSLEEPLIIGERKVNSTPLGFSQNVNQTIRLALAENADLYFLNNDLVLFEGWLDALQRMDPAILSPLSNREVQYRLSAGVVNGDEAMKIFITGNPMSLEEYERNRGAIEFAAETHRQRCDGELPVMCLPFYCVKLPLAVMEEVGLFDESFGRAGGEDYDYSLRAYLAGFGTSYALNSWILHFGGKSSWSGVESREEQLKREEYFFGVFAEKWGEDLHDLILKEDSSILDKHGISGGHTRGVSEIQSNLRQLMQGKDPVIYLK